MSLNLFLKLFLVLLLIPVQTLALLLCKTGVKTSIRADFRGVVWQGKHNEFGPWTHSKARYTANSNYGPVERSKKSAKPGSKKFNSERREHAVNHKTPYKPPREITPNHYNYRSRTTKNMSEIFK